MKNGFAVVETNDDMPKGEGLVASMHSKKGAAEKAADKLRKRCDPDCKFFVSPAHNMRPGMTVLLGRVRPLGVVG